MRKLFRLVCLIFGHKRKIDYFCVWCPRCHAILVQTEEEERIRRPMRFTDGVNLR